jgi:hypothetical protein
MSKKNKTKQNKNGAGAKSHPMSGLGSATIENAVGNSAMVRETPPPSEYVVGRTREETMDYKRVQVTTVGVYSAFVVEKALRFDWDGKPMYENMMFRLLPDQRELRDFLRDASEIRDFHRSNPPMVELARLVDEIDSFEDDLDEYRDKTSVVEFVTFIQSQVEETRAIYERLISMGKISYDLLSMYFKKGSKIAFGGTTDHELEGSVVTGFEYGFGFGGPYFEVNTVRYSSNGKYFGKLMSSFKIGGFRGDIPLTDLPAHLATPEELKTLTQRGEVWQKHVHVPQYLSYTGKIEVKVGWNKVQMTANGRCMIDLAMHEQIVDTDRWDRTSFDAETDLTELPVEYLFTAPGYVKGFSMSKKKWGTFRFSGLTPIAFRDDAYDLLVLDPEVKAEVRALVEQSDDMFSDIISGKGGGAIFLLHGTPGLGKTLTAESVAEILHRPLYSISVGELGVTPGEVEETLQNVLEMVTAWNAVLLLDEADIFLEARSKDDIVRNAMVGVFLRLLEYHNGVLFLTTNRVANFDTAVLSRISVILKYPDFTDEIRYTVWTNILSAAGLGDLKIDLAYMSRTYPVNGRQIKNAIRISLSLAASMNVPVSQKLIEGRLERMLNVTNDLVGVDPLLPAVVPKQKLRGA